MRHVIPLRGFFLRLQRKGGLRLSKTATNATAALNEKEESFERLLAARGREREIVSLGTCVMIPRGDPMALAKAAACESVAIRLGG